MPIKILTSVLLPAPFSPQTARISPGASENDMSCKARTPGYDLLMLSTDKSSGTQCLK
jgi:hypothetical protein